MKIGKDKIGWGILGPGLIAHQFCDCLGELPDAYVAAIGSRSIERSRELADLYGGIPYGSYEAMLNDPYVDVVYVATPHPMHEEHVIMAANAGKAILCEKPFAVNRRQAENMFEAARKNDVFIMEGLWSRFFPAWQFVIEELASGEFGRIESIYASTGWGSDRQSFRDPSHRVLNPKLAGGSLLDAGVYSLAVMSSTRGRFEMPKKLYSLMEFTETGVDSDVDMMMEFDDGMVAHLSCSLFRRDMEAKIICEKGIISVPVNRNPSRVVIQKPVERSAKLVGEEIRTGRQEARDKRDYYGSMRSLPISQRRMGGDDVITMDFPYRKAGFQFEAEIVQDCLRKGLKFCPDVTPEETLLLVGICDEVRRAGNLVYPFEK